MKNGTKFIAAIMAASLLLAGCGAGGGSAHSSAAMAEAPAANYEAGAIADEDYGYAMGEAEMKAEETATEEPVEAGLHLRHLHRDAGV